MDTRRSALINAVKWSRRRAVSRCMVGAEKELREAGTERASEGEVVLNLPPTSFLKASTCRRRHFHAADYYSDIPHHEVAGVRDHAQSAAARRCRGMYVTDLPGCQLK